MIVSGQLKFSPTGRVLIIRNAPIAPGSLTPTNARGYLCFEDNNNPPYYNDELGYGIDGRLCVQGSPPVKGEKGVRIATTEPIVAYWNGLPFTATGRLAVTEIIGP